MQKLVNGQLVEMTPQEEAAFEAARLGTLPQAKQRMRASLSLRRRRAEAAGFDHLGSRFPSGANVVSAAALMAAIDGQGGPFSISVETADGSIVTMNAAQYQAYRRALAGHVKACSDRASTALQAIAAAQTPQEAVSVDIDSGWPA